MLMRAAEKGMSAELWNTRHAVANRGYYCFIKIFNLATNRGVCSCSATVVPVSDRCQVSPAQNRDFQLPALAGQQPLLQQPLHQQCVQAVSEWQGLHQWRAKGINPLRGWGLQNKPSEEIPSHGIATATTESIPLPDSLVGVALQVLNTAEPSAKAAVTHRGWKAYCLGHIPLHPPSQLQQPHYHRQQEQQDMHKQHLMKQQQQQQSQQYGDHQRGQNHHHRGVTETVAPPSSTLTPPDRPARPPKPQLVAPRDVPSPKASPLPLTAHMLHNLAHIELNAVDLAWDTVARYSHLNLPPIFYEDFARVADDESRHFGWCVQRMAELGYSYGDMVAHDLLWEGAQASAGDLGARLAIVPLSQEARGLDAGQRLVERLVGAGDKRSASIVELIAAEERAHVAVGVVWFTRLCDALAVDPPTAFRAWLTALAPELLKGPFNHPARQEVGLHRNWYDTTQWPPELTNGRLVQPAVAAAARGKGMQVLTGATAPHEQRHQQEYTSRQRDGQQKVQARGWNAEPGQQKELVELAASTWQDVQHVQGTEQRGQQQWSLQPVLVPQEGALLEQLRQRLWSMIQDEAEMSSAVIH